MSTLGKLFLAEVELRQKVQISPFYIVKWQMDDYDLHLLVVTDSISQHGDLVEHSETSSDI